MCTFHIYWCNLSSFFANDYKKYPDVVYTREDSMNAIPVSCLFSYKQKVSSRWFRVRPEISKLAEPKYPVTGYPVQFQTMRFRWILAGAGPDSPVSRYPVQTYAEFVILCQVLRAGGRDYGRLHPLHLHVLCWPSRMLNWPIVTKKKYAKKAFNLILAGNCAERKSMAANFTLIFYPSFFNKLGPRVISSVFAHCSNYYHKNIFFVSDMLYKQLNNKNSTEKNILYFH